MLKNQQMENGMETTFNTLRRCPLFCGIGDQELPAMLDCLGARESAYKKGDTILAEGDPPRHIGIVLEGKAQIERVDYYGNRSILTVIEPSHIFGEAFAFAGLSEMPVDVVASENTRVLLMDARRITRDDACAFHSRMIFNLLTIVARKNLVFHRKIEITSRRTTREKLMAYLLLMAKDCGSSTFTIPYSRQELADYLEVDRSGLSAEISRLRNEGVLLCRKSTFTLC